MARATRIVLDLTLYSIKAAHPAISNVWGAAKSKLSDTRAGFIIDNKVVTKMETLLDSATVTTLKTLTAWRNQQLPREKIYLEKELQDVIKKLAVSQKVRDKVTIAWQYLKVECVPPLTVAIFNGPIGEKMENFVSSATTRCIGAIEKQRYEIDAAEERKKREEETAANVAKEKALALALKNKQELEKKGQAESAAKEKVALDAARAANKKEDAKKPPEIGKNEMKKKSKREASKLKKIVKRDPKKKK